MSRIETKLKELGYALPEPMQSRDGFITPVLVGDVLYVPGSGPCRVNGELKYQGRLGAEYSVEEGYEAAKSTMLNLLATVKSFLGDLDKLERIIKVNGYVNSAPDFFQQPQVIHGASELLVALLGDEGKHARTAIGTSNLPMNIPVEIEMIVKIKSD